MPTYLKKRRQTYYFRYRYPADVAAHKGADEFVRTLKTREKHVALRRVPLLLSYMHYYVDVFRKQRATNDDLFLTEVAKSYRDQIKDGFVTVEEAEQFYEDDISVYFQTVHKVSVDESVMTEEQIDRLSIAREIIKNPKSILLSDAVQLYLNHVYDENNPEISVKPKTYSTIKRRVGAFVDFLTIDKLVSDITEQDAVDFVKNYINELDLEYTTKSDYISYMSTFFEWLHVNLYVKDNFFYKRQKLIRAPNGLSYDEDSVRKIWTRDQLISLLCMLPNYRSSNTKQLISCSLIALYSGMRSNEICEMKIEDVHIRDNCMFIREGKTKSSIRGVPIHPLIMPLIKLLHQTSTDGYLVSDLKRGGEDNKRNHNLVKAFSYLKKDKLKLPENLVFHSFRHNFCTLLEQFLIPETIAKQIVGHEKQDMTYGWYSNGHEIQQMMSYVSKLSHGQVDDYASGLIDIYKDKYCLNIKHRQLW
ncbi:MAG: tyrosine-type recombinase/integrase [Methylomonas sp.]